MKRLTVFGSIALLATALSIPAYAQRGDRGGGGRARFSGGFSARQFSGGDAVRAPGFSRQVRGDGFRSGGFHRSSGAGDGRARWANRADGLRNNSGAVTTRFDRSGRTSGNRNWANRDGNWRRGDGNWRRGDGNWRRGDGNWQGRGRWAGRHWRHRHRHHGHHHHHHHFPRYYYASYYPWGYYGYPYFGASLYYDGYNSGYYGDGYAAGSSGNLVANVQEELARAGFYHGEIDGVLGPRTRSAIRAFERANGLPADGRVDQRLLSRMGLA